MVKTMKSILNRKLIQNSPFKHADILDPRFVDIDLIAIERVFFSKTKADNWSFADKRIWGLRLYYIH